jgi:hypothetical protein
LQTIGVGSLTRKKQYAQKGFYTLQYRIENDEILHMKILLGDFNAKVGREDIFQPTIANESSHEISNDNGVRIGNFATLKNMSKVQCSHIVTFINAFGHLLIRRHTIKLTIF